MKILSPEELDMVSGGEPGSYQDRGYGFSFNGTDCVEMADGRISCTIPGIDLEKAIEKAIQNPPVEINFDDEDDEDDCVETASAENDSGEGDGEGDGGDGDGDGGDGGNGGDGA